MDHDQSPKPTNNDQAAVSDAAADKVETTKTNCSLDDHPANEEQNHDVISSTDGSNHDDPESYDMVNLDQQTRREFTCKFCEKKFRTKQALGGHQNAHKAERASHGQSSAYRNSASSLSHVVGSMMSSNLFSSRLFHAPMQTTLVNNQLSLAGLAGYYQRVAPQPYAGGPPYHQYLHNVAAVNSRPGLAFNNNSAAAAAINNHHRPVLGFGNVVVNSPPRFVGSNNNVYGGLYSLAPPTRVPLRFAGANMNPIPAVVEEEEADADEAGLDLSLKLGYSNR